MVIDVQSGATLRAKARISSFVREANVAIRDLNRRLGARDGYRLLCECGDHGCAERIDVPPGVYETLLDTESRIVAPHHAPRDTGVVAHAVYAVVAPT